MRLAIILLGLAAAAQPPGGPQSPWIRPQAYTLAGKPTFGVTNRLVFITDCESTSACSVGGGSTRWLFRDTGTAWERAHPIGSGGGGTGCIVSGSDNQIVTDDGAGGCVSEAQWMIAAGVLTAGASGAADFGSATYLKIPTSAGAAPTANGRIAYDSTANKYKFGANASTKTVATEDGNIATSTALAANGGNCSGNLPRGVDASGAAEGCADVDLTSEVTGVLPNANTTAASANTPSAIVTRDASGNFSAGTITAALNGNSSTASGLAANGGNCSAGSYPIGVDASGAAESCTTVASETVTYTNKIIDAEATGNVLTVSSKVWMQAAGCLNATAGLFWDTPTSNPAVAACVTGTNTQKGVADFADGANSLSLQTGFQLPSDWTGAIDAKLIWLSSTTSGNVVWQVATICVATGETDDPAFNTASTVTDATQGTANQLNEAAITGVTTTGCAAGENLHLKVFRDPTNGSDTMAGTARLVGVELTVRRAI